MATVHYQPLPEGSIRILNLLPGPAESIIECTLSHTRLDESHDNYDALSYCWGDPTPVQPVVCNGSQLYIAANLHSALLRLRRPSDVKTIWADAICINQKDSAEKSAQVCRMRDIYARAREIIIWLGEHFEDSKRALDFVKECAEHWAVSGRPSGTSDATGESGPYQHVRTFASPPVKAFLTLITRPWFTRVWIIQEVATAGDRAVLHVGSDTVTWSNFVNVCEWIMESGNGVYAPSRLQKPLTIAAASAEFNGQGHNPSPRSLLYLLLRHRPFEASDVRDKVFALCGLASDMAPTVQGSFKISYDTKIEDVYRALAAHYLLFKDLSILSVPHGLNEPISLPSWVPRWDNLDTTKSLLILNPAKSKDWLTSGSSPPVVNMSNGTHLLGLKGIIVDSVAEVGDVWEERGIESLEFTPSAVTEVFKFVRRQLSTFTQWETMAKIDSVEMYAPTGETSRDVFRQTIIGGCSTLEEYELMKQKYDEVNHLYRWHRIVLTLGLQKFLPAFIVAVTAVNLLYLCEVKLGMSEPKTLDHMLQAAIADAATHRRFCKTAKGFVGMFPRTCSSGDIVAIVCGARAPIILRRTGRTDVYKHIGDAYVHGMMHGERFEEQLCKEIWLE